jgi:hypothetical protein
MATTADTSSLHPADPHEGSAAAAPAQSIPTQSGPSQSPPAGPASAQPAVPRQKPVNKLGVAAVVVTVVLWASAFVGIRAVGPSFSPAP